MTLGIAYWNKSIAKFRRTTLPVKQGCHIDASITQSPRKPKTRPTYEVVDDREERDDEADSHTSMRIVEVTQPSVDSEARWIKEGGQSLFGYKQHTMINSNDHHNQINLYPPVYAAWKRF